MISSKRINLIAVILVVLAVVLVVIMMIVPHNSENILGAVAYQGGQTIEYDSTDYYSNYTGGDYSRIIFDGDAVAVSSSDVTVSGTDVTINCGGVYELSGTVADGSVTINAADGAMVRLILNGVNITSSDSAAICIEKSAKTVISLIDGTVNTLTDGTEYINTNSDATIYSKDDLVINGGGTLVVNANYADAIKVNDGLKIIDGNIEVTAVDEAINVNDYVVISGGVIRLNSGGDAIKCGNEETPGFIALEGGTVDITTATDAVYAYSDVYVNDIIMSISAGDDAVHSEETLYLNGGTFNITSSIEGLEGAYIVMNGGEYTVVSSDDGVNATGKGSTNGMMENPGMRGGHGAVSSEVYLTINGGTLHAQVDGDGLDSNAAALINGGYIEVYGPENNGNSTLDFDGGFAINGGTVIAAGSSGMAESPTSESKQNVIVVALSTTYEAGTAFSLKDSGGNEIASGTSAKRFDWLCISSDEIKTDSTYTVTVGDTEEASVTVENSVTSVRNSTGGSFDGMGGDRGGMGGMMPPDGAEKSVMPEEMRMPNDKKMSPDKISNENAPTSKDTTENISQINWEIAGISIFVLILSFGVIAAIKRKY